MLQKFVLLTIFPQFFDSYLQQSLVGKALAKGLFEVEVWDLRAYTEDKHKRVDDIPYGGGVGMVFKPEPLAKAIEGFKAQCPQGKVIYFSPKGQVLQQNLVRESLNLNQEILLICGRYEGIDQRIIDLYVDQEISIGDYILSGGEIAAQVFLDACLRLIPGVVGKEESLEEESIEWGLLEYPHYTRPEEFEGLKVPEVLLSGNHQKIKEWRLQKAQEATQERRPDLLKKMSDKFDKKKSS